MLYKKKVWKFLNNKCLSNLNKSVKNNFSKHCMSAKIFADRISIVIPVYGFVGKYLAIINWFAHYLPSAVMGTKYA